MKCFNWKPSLLYLGLVFCATIFGAQAQKPQVNPDLLTKPWSAFWIGVPRSNTGGFGGFRPPAPAEFSVYHFRKNFDLTAKPGSFIIHLSADNRYKLYVNGVQVSHGPAASSPKYWNFETVDIAQYLQPGKNTVAALVWNAVGLAPIVQMSNGQQKIQLNKGE